MCTGGRSGSNPAGAGFEMERAHQGAPQRPRAALSCFRWLRGVRSKSLSQCQGQGRMTSPRPGVPITFYPMEEKQSDEHLQVGLGLPCDSP